MSINIIAGIAKKRVIGFQGGLPWNISKDLKYFKNMTSGENSAIVMGRKTWDSLPIRPLPNRSNYVLTKNNFKSTFPDGLVLKEPDDIIILRKIYSDIWIIGGEAIYKEYINKPYVDRLYLTEIDSVYEGDTYFPKIPNNFKKITQGKDILYKKNALEFSSFNFNVYCNYGYYDGCL